MNALSKLVLAGAFSTIGILHVSAQEFTVIKVHLDQTMNSNQ